jgi:hypothetical protein
MSTNGTFHFDNAAVGLFGQQIGPLDLQVHSPDKCTGRACCIHAPSAHHMRQWPLNLRADRGPIMFCERICPEHHCGHPDPDDLAWHISQGREWVAVHGCCGCCHAEDT